MTGGDAPAAGTPPGPGSEIEATLVVCSERPRAVARRLARISEVDGHPVEWVGTARLRDLYFERDDGTLRERGLALRLREEGGSWTLTLKGDARPGPGGEVERMELEAPWSNAALARVLAELRRRSVEVSDDAPPAAAEGVAEPAEALRAAGFRVLQERRTRRRTARVLPAGGGEPVATLALDAVRFRTRSGRPALHREIEVEASGRAPEGLPGRLASRLVERFGSELRTWRHGKLATGLAVGEVEPPRGADGDLTGDAYDLLEERLAGGGRSA